jgi:hypothetical protein
MPLVHDPESGLRAADWQPTTEYIHCWALRTPKSCQPDIAVRRSNGDMWTHRRVLLRQGSGMFSIKRHLHRADSRSVYAGRREPAHIRPTDTAGTSWHLHKVESSGWLARTRMPVGISGIEGAAGLE